MDTLFAFCAENRKPRQRSAGRYRHSGGYIYVRVEGGKYKGEHRVVMERFLNRPLAPFEVVHHANGVKDDNAPENLRLMHRGKHLHLHKHLRRERILRSQLNLFPKEIFERRQESLFACL